MVRSMCCRLQLDLRELLKRGNGLFGSAEQTGSVGVVTINTARLGYRYAGDHDGLYRELDRLLESGKRHAREEARGDPGGDRRRPVPVHQALPRDAPQPLLDHRRQRRQRDDPQLHAATSTTSRRPEGEALAAELLDYVRERMVQFQEETGHLYNLEATPAEGTTYRFAKVDRKEFPDIIQAGTPGAAVLHQLVATSGRVHGRPVRGDPPSELRSSPSTRVAPCSTSTCASAYRTPRRASNSSSAPWRPPAFPTSPSPPPSRSARSTGTSTASTSHLPPVRP